MLFNIIYVNNIMFKYLLKYRTLYYSFEAQNTCYSKDIHYQHYFVYFFVNFCPILLFIICIFIYLSLMTNTLNSKYF